jgi:RNA polymerase sigma factor (sigma-70 family)
MISKQQLIDIQSGNKKVLDEVLRDNGGLITYCIKKFSRTESKNWDDMFQYTSIAFIKAIRMFDVSRYSKQSLSAYLVSAMRNWLFRLHKINSRKILLYDYAPVEELQIGYEDNHEDYAWLHDEISHLNSDERSIVTEHYFNNKTQSSISRERNESHAATNHKLHKALHKLKFLIKREVLI